MEELQAGRRPRMDALTRDHSVIEQRATTALVLLVSSITEHPKTGQSARLVRFLAGLYNGQDYPFDLTDHRGLDTALANACLDYLNYDRLGLAEVHLHLPGGSAKLETWLTEYGITPTLRS